MKKTEECQVHGAPSRAANKTLLLMLLASFSLIAWHVWSFGPTLQTANPALMERSFVVRLGREMWDMLFNPHGIAAELRDIFPYFIVGILIAGYIRTYKIAVKLQASLRKYGYLSVFLASLVGILTPLCACGTLTTAVSLLFAGLPLAPVMSLLVTSPLMSPSTYLLTMSELGPEWTVIRTIAAFSMGIFAGTITHLLRNKGFRTEDIFIEGAIPRGDFHDEAYPDERLRCNCKEKFGHRVAAKTDSMFVIFLAKSSEMLWLVGKYVLVGVVMGIIVERYMPYEWIYRFFGEKDPLSVIWVALASVPLFLHQISASSIVYHIKSSLHGTIDGGAALAFMIGGPVTAVPTLVMFWTIFKKRAFFLYLFVCLAGTILISYAFQFLVFVPYADTGNPLLKGVSAVSGGTSTAIQKNDEHVRIVMDPNGKNMIATYTNDVEGQGGVVFDSGFGRFLNGPADKYDTQRYIGNVAAWLEQNNTSAAKKSILIYDTFHGSGLAADAFSRKAVSLLEKKGFRVRLTDRRETPVITGGLLGEYSQIWMLFGNDAGGSYLSGAELEAISQFTGDGRSMLIVAGTQRGGVNDLAAANEVSSRYGVLFAGSVQNGEELPAATAAYFFSRAARVIGSILKVVHKA
ncbi:MAG: permease [Nitrospiraceae bacterium]|nr:permease [Nitrospiraceae bacterium]